MLEKRVAAIGKLCFGLAGMLAGDATARWASVGGILSTTFGRVHLAPAIPM
jgi:hypothetical protein